MPSDYLNQVLSNGVNILTDTKTPKKPKAPATSIEKAKVPETDPHKAFVRRCIAERPKKEDVVKDLKRFIDAAEAEM
jgi:hypothetical protein